MKTCSSGPNQAVAHQCCEPAGRGREKPGINADQGRVRRMVPGLRMSSTLGDTYHSGGKVKKVLLRKQLDVCKATVSGFLQDKGESSKRQKKGEEMSGKGSHWLTCGQLYAPFQFIRLRFSEDTGSHFRINS